MTRPGHVCDTSKTCPQARLTQLYSEAFALAGMAVLEMHSRKSQAQRTRVADQFRDGDNLIMFSSDVSARGMDYPDVTAVVQVGMPSEKAQYIHRIGRTGRAGSKGIAVSFITSADIKVAAPLVAILRDAGQKVPAALEKMAALGGGGGGGGSRGPRKGAPSASGAGAGPGLYDF